MSDETISHLDKKSTQLPNLGYIDRNEVDCFVAKNTPRNDKILKELIE